MLSLFMSHFYNILNLVTLADLFVLGSCLVTFYLVLNLALVQTVFHLNYSQKMSEKRERFWCQPPPSPPSRTSEPLQLEEDVKGSSQDIGKMVHDQLHRKMAAAGLISRDENVSSLFSFDSDKPSNADEEILEFDCADRLLTLQSSWGSCESLERDIIEEINYNEKEDLEGFELRPVYEAFLLNAIERPWEEKLVRIYQ
uniref:Uncharacterized protein n=2 Tax=Cacopsylla melanoneura TaxID=428564 RepID=A0A8D8ZEK0_9HEMI